jgi:hypothetical protein
MHGVSIYYKLKLNSNLLVYFYTQILIKYNEMITFTCHIFCQCNPLDTDSLHGLLVTHDNCEQSYALL